MEHDPVGAFAAAEDLLERRHLVGGCLGGHVQVNHLVAHPEFVPRIVESEDFVGDDFRLLGALLVVARGCAGINLAPNDHDRVRQQQVSTLFEDPGEDDNFDRRRQVLELDEGHRLAGFRDDGSHRLDHAADPDLVVLHIRRDLVRIRIDFGVELLLDAPQRVIGQIETEQLFLALEPLLVGHWRDVGDQPGGWVVELIGIGQHAEQVGLPAFALADDLRRPVADAVDAGEQAAPLTQAVRGAGADQALEHALVHFARVDPDGEIK